MDERLEQVGPERMNQEQVEPQQRAGWEQAEPQPAGWEQVEPERLDQPPDMEGSSSTSIDYSLKFTGWPTVPQLVAVAVATAVYTVLSWLAIISLPSTYAGVSTVFLAIGFGIAFALWFGGWAFVIAYIGNFVGAGLMTGSTYNRCYPFWGRRLDPAWCTYDTLSFICPPLRCQPNRQRCLYGPRIYLFPALCRAA